jgi:hypothetical protein
MNKLSWVTLPVIAASLIGWGAWATVGVTRATPRDVFDEHVQRAQDKYEQGQEKIQRSLDDIKDTILELHKK